MVSESPGKLWKEQNLPACSLQDDGTLQGPCELGGGEAESTRETSHTKAKNTVATRAKMVIVVFNVNSYWC